LQGLQQGLAAPATATVLAAEAGRLHALVLVLRALAQPDPAIGESPRWLCSRCRCYITSCGSKCDRQGLPQTPAGHLSPCQWAP